MRITSAALRASATPTLPISAKYGAISVGSTGFGCRRRAACATCSARSPIRSMSPAPWIADTTIRRSVATGACRASSANAFASAASRTSSIRMSSEMTSSASCRSLFQQGPGRLLQGVGHLLAHPGQSLGELVELFLVGVAHALRVVRGAVHQPGLDMNPG